MNKIARFSVDSSLLVLLFLILIFPVAFLRIGNYESATSTQSIQQTEQNVLPSSDTREYPEIKPEQPMVEILVEETEEETEMESSSSEDTFREEF
jgi:hypothetical protein